LVGAGGVSAVGLRLGDIGTFSCSLSRLAAVQGSSLIVSLPRFVRRVERSEYSTGRERGAVPGDKNPPARWCSGRSRSWPFSALASAVSDRLKAYPAPLLVRWRLCADSGHPRGGCRAARFDRNRALIDPLWRYGRSRRTLAAPQNELGRGTSLSSSWAIDPERHVDLPASRRLRGKPK